MVRSDAPTTFETSVMVSGLLIAAFTQASNRLVLIATQRWILTAFSEYPQRALMVRLPLIHLKNLCVASHKLFYDKYIIMQS